MRYIIWFIASFFAFFQFYLQTAAGIIGAEWMRDFHLDKVGLSNLSAAFFYTYAFMQIPAGILIDRFPLRYILTMAAFILTLGNGLLAYTDNYHIALIARLLMGIGSSFGFVGLLQVCATYFSPKRFAFAVGVSEGAAMFGVTIGIVLLTWLVAHYSWRILIYGSAGISFLVMIAAFCLMRPPSTITHVSHQHINSLKVIAQRLKLILTNRHVILGSLYGFFMFSIVTAFASLWGVSFLMNTYAFDRQIAANMVATIFIGIAFGGPFSGWLSKGVKHPSILLGASILAVFSMSAVVFIAAIPSIILYLLFFLSGAFAAAYIQCFAVIKESVHPSIRATALATANMIIMLGAPVFQLIIGSLLQSHFFGMSNDMASVYRYSLGLLPVGLVVAVILALKIRE